MDDAELHERLTTLRAEGVWIIDAIKFVRTEAGVDLGEAKRLVTRHPAWHDIQDAHREFHEKLIRTFTDE